MKCVFIILILAKFVSIKCEDDYDCTPEHLENCQIDGDEYNSVDWEDDPARASEIVKKINYNLTTMTIPKNFDSRTHWPQCADVISRIKSQGACHNCWSFSSTMVLADRVCIASNGTDKAEFSIAHLNNCCPKCPTEPEQPPCRHGGRIQDAWEYAVTNGMVFEECKPYTIAKVNTTVGRCAQNCEDATLPIETVTHKTNLVVYARHFPDLNQVKAEIMTYGPVCGHLENLTHEFKTYFRSTGIFVPQRPIPKPPKKSGHSIRIIGWGAENGSDGKEIKYWIIANSWGTKWGDKGMVKLSMGSNDFDIEEKFYAGRTGPLRKIVSPDVPNTVEPPAEETTIPGVGAASDLSSKFLVFTMIIFFFVRQFLL